MNEEALLQGIAESHAAFAEEVAERENLIDQFPVEPASADGDWKPGVNFPAEAETFESASDFARRWWGDRVDLKLQSLDGSEFTCADEKFKYPSIYEIREGLRKLGDTTAPGVFVLPDHWRGHVEIPDHQKARYLVGIVEPYFVTLECLRTVPLSVVVQSVFEREKERRREGLPTANDGRRITA